MSENEKIIELKKVTKSFGGKTAVDAIDLYIRKGEFVTFLGPSGCGKTTTLRMIAGFETPTSGEVLLGGVSLVEIPPHLRPVNTVFQRYALFPHYNVYNNIAFGLKMQRSEKEKPLKGNFFTKAAAKLSKRVREKDGEYVFIAKEKTPKSEIDKKVKSALKMVGLSDYEKRDVSSLSGGQQQRVAIARALVNEPAVLLLDEPLGALDLKMRQEMQLELKEMHKKLGITFVYVTHDQEEALTMSDTIVVMKDGHIMQIGTPLDIYNEPKNIFVADFIGESNILDGTMLCDKKANFLSRTFDCVDEGFGAGEPVDIVLRPEDIEIKEKGKGQIDGKVISSFFRGVHYEMEVMVNGCELTVHSTVEAQAGKEIAVYVSPENIHVMRKERYANAFDAVYKGGNLVIDGAKFAFDASCCADMRVDEEGSVLYKDENCEGGGFVVEVGFDKIDITDDEKDAPLAGNIISIYFKGNHYFVTIRTDSGMDVFAKTQYTWDNGDRVGIKIAESDFIIKSRKEEIAK